MHFLAAAALSLATVLAPHEASEDIAVLRRALESVHPGLVRYVPKPKVDAMLARLETRARQSITPDDLYVEVSRVLAAVHCDHTKAEYPAALAQYRREHPTHLPFRFRLIDGRMFVYSSSDAESLPRGTEVLSIDGQPIAAIVDGVKPLVSYDGATAFVVPSRLEADSDLLGSAASWCACP